MPHLGLAHLAAVLKQAGHTVSLLDCAAEGIGEKRFRALLKEMRPRVMGITADTSFVNLAHQTCRAAKEIHPDLLTVIGGSHVTALPAQTLEEFPAFDVAVQGEGEQTFLELMEAVQSGSSFADIRGTSCREGDVIRSAEPREVIGDLDNLPLPDWEIFPLQRYRSMWGIHKKLEFPIMTGRGCPHRCVFCQRSMGREIRMMSPGRIVEEMERDVKLGAKSLIFCDETFTLQKKRTLEICEAILKKGLQKRLTWNCETRVDHVDEEILRAMRRAGCSLISYGVESGNDQVLRHSKKDITVEQIREAFHLARKVGLKTYMLLIFGLPFETERSLQDTINLMMEVNPHYVSIGILVPFPGTEALEMAQKGIGGLRLLSRRWNDYGKHMGDAIELKQLPANKLKAYQSKAYTTFYFRPSRILNLFELASLRGILEMIRNRVFRK